MKTRLLLAGFVLAVAGSYRAGIIHGIPDSLIIGVVLSDITLTAEKDFDIRDAANPAFRRVTRIIKPGVAPPRFTPFQSR